MKPTDTGQYALQYFTDNSCIFLKFAERQIVNGSSTFPSQGSVLLFVQYYKHAMTLCLRDVSCKSVKVFRIFKETGGERGGGGWWRHVDITP